MEGRSSTFLVFWTPTGYVAPYPWADGILPFSPPILTQNGEFYIPSLDYSRMLHVNSLLTEAGKICGQTEGQGCDRYDAKGQRVDNLDVKTPSAADNSTKSRQSDQVPLTKDDQKVESTEMNHFKDLDEGREKTGHEVSVSVFKN